MLIQGVGLARLTAWLGLKGTAIGEVVGRTAGGSQMIYFDWCQGEYPEAEFDGIWHTRGQPPLHDRYGDRKRNGEPPFPAQAEEDNNEVPPLPPAPQ